MVATTSASRCPPVARSVSEIETTASSNMPLASAAPAMAAEDLGWHIGGGIAPPQPAERSVGERDGGVEVRPETGPKMRISAKSPAAVAAAFSRSCRPTSSLSCCAAIPEPITSAARERRAKEFSEEPASERGGHAGRASVNIAGNLRLRAREMWTGL